MKRFSSITRSNCARWIFICGVLTGLFFSGGEGIQLLPFPTAEAGNSKIAASGHEKNPISYAFSVFSPRNYSALLKLKFQKDAYQYLSGQFLTLNRADARAGFRLRPVRKRPETSIVSLSSVPDSQSGRAPPIIQN